MDKSIIVLGRGFLGKEFERAGFQAVDDYIHTDEASSRKYLDLMCKDHDVIINCIGITDVRWCQNPYNFSEVMFVNGMLPRVISKWCHDNGKKFVHISSGCIYGGDDNFYSYRESDVPMPKCVYSLTKYVGDLYCSPVDDIIIRPRLLFSDVKHKSNFLYRLQNFPSFVYDREDSLTATCTVVRTVEQLIKEDCSGIFNVAQKGKFSIYEIAKMLEIVEHPQKITMDELRLKEGVTLSNVVMDCSKANKFYTPINLIDSLFLCYSQLKDLG